MKYNMWNKARQGGKKRVLGGQSKPFSVILTKSKHFTTKGWKIGLEVTQPCHFYGHVKMCSCVMVAFLFWWGWGED